MKKIMIVLIFFFTTAFSCIYFGPIYEMEINIAGDDQAALTATEHTVRNRLSDVMLLREMGGSEGKYRLEFNCNLDDPQMVRKLVTQRGELNFCEVVTWEELGLLYDHFIKIWNSYPENPDDIIFRESFIPTTEYDEVDDSYDIVSNAPYIATVDHADLPRLMTVLDSPAIRAVIPSDCRFAPSYLAENGDYKLYVIRVATNTGEWTWNDHITNAYARNNTHGPYNEVAMNFDKEGTLRWQQLTRDNIGRNIAIMIDRHVMSAPRVNQEITGGHR